MLRLNRVSRMLGCAWTLLVAMTVLGQAQELSDTALVVKNGTATIYTPPTHAVFWIHRTIAADALNLSLEDATKIDPAIREAVTLKELRPSSLQTGAPAIVSMEENTVRVSTELRFSMSAYASGESAVIRFGELCEQIKEVAATVAGEISGPTFETTEKAKAVEDAVKEASKDAFLGVAGAAEALNATVRAVDTIEVEDILWNAPPDTEISFPTVSQLACTAKVRISYILDYH